jgi:hypothetical protein
MRNRGQREIGDERNPGQTELSPELFANIDSFPLWEPAPPPLHFLLDPTLSFMILYN